MIWVARRGSPGSAWRRQLVTLARKPATAGTLVAAGLMAAAVVVAVFVAAPFGPDMVDLAVYRAGARALIDGGDVYAVTGPGGLPFTYPIFAALLFVPLALLPAAGAQVVMTATSLAGLFALVHLTLRTVLGRADRDLLRLSLPATAAAGAAYPAFGTLCFGQVNLVLAALVLADILLVRGRWRGVLTGVATGVKLTPGLFLLYYLVTGQWRAARNAALTAAATLAAGLLLAPGSTWAYLTRYILDPSRTGDVSFPGNQSLLALTARLLHRQHPPGALTWVLAAVVVVAALAAARRLHARGEELTAACTVAAAALLASPVSWTHHWVWCIPATGVLAAWAHRSGGGWRWWTLGAGLVTMWLGPMQWTSAFVLRDAYVLLGLAFIGWAVRQAWTAPPSSERSRP